MNARKRVTLSANLPPAGKRGRAAIPAAILEAADKLTIAAKRELTEKAKVRITLTVEREGRA